MRVIAIPGARCDACGEQAIKGLVSGSEFVILSGIGRVHLCLQHWGEGHAANIMAINERRKSQLSQIPAKSRFELIFEEIE